MEVKVKKLNLIVQLPAWMRGSFHLCQGDQLLLILGMILRLVSIIPPYQCSYKLKLKLKDTDHVAYNRLQDLEHPISSTVYVLNPTLSCDMVYLRDKTSWWRGIEPLIFNNLVFSALFVLCTKTKWNLRPVLDEERQNRTRHEYLRILKVDSSTLWLFLCNLVFLFTPVGKH